ncbi:hypothetical protein H310_03777 [Aphanomyces invadans]|uniref:Choline transporter-like protein n=1 Tax=Aphanomyces invadans TaxID=157072 RepID=A0A024UDR3_9STRA|nr:hypothetical protein H310_03777 [Aphanomyces invadans]ETW04546.1 hypothetical protein H310_03777 [Aphanomyces invadans]RHY34554.1 hypothetical protein DYB32_000865 [Aphanomyces invadans]|eukprot:XP_008865984.1 hypothetical protein H310_03777 [Aphanomyces invadans]
MYKNDPPAQYAAHAQPVDAYGQPIAMAAPVPYTSSASVGNVTPIKPSVSAPSGFRDWPFALLFIANIGAIVALLIMYGSTVFKALNGTSKSAFSSSTFSSGDVKTILYLCGGLSVIAAVLSLVMLNLTIRFARQMIQVALWWSVVMFFGFTAFAVIRKLYTPAIIFAIIGLFALCYAYAVQSRIPFAAANLRAAGAAIRKHPSTHLVAFAFLIVQIAWVFAWAFAVVGITNKMTETSTPAPTPLSATLSNGRRCSSSLQCFSNYCFNAVCQEPNVFATLKSTSYVAYFFLLLSFFWGVQVFKNIIHATVAGTVATWWFSSDSKGATGASLGRATTTSLGSICLGSLIVAILQTLRQLAEEAARQGDCAACIAQCILGCLQSLMETFNRWAFVYVGIYGYKFIDAGRAVMQLFHDRGFDAIINDDLVGTALTFAAFGVGCLCALLGLVYYYIDVSNQFQYAQYILPLIGLFFGLGVAIIPMGVVDSAVATVFVCFAEDPVALQHSHPEHFSDLMTEWHRQYPEIMVTSGYYVVA